MKSLVVYFSKFGYTQKVAQAIAETLAAAGPVDVISSDQLDESSLNGAELVVMGSPTHRMNLPEAVKPVFMRLPKRFLRGVRVAAFDTSYKMSPWLAHFTAGPRLDHKLRKLGGKRVIPAETFHVIEKQGPLYDGEIERAQDWAVAILRQLEPQAV